MAPSAQHLIPYINTALTAEDLRVRLKQWEPWSIRIDFSNGVSTTEFSRRIPFAEHPLNKFGTVEMSIPFQELSPGKILDIGCNSGYNSIHAALKYGFRPVGIDVSERHISVSRFLADLAGVESEFLIANAEEFSRLSEFDVILHFGTLYHLANPLRALERSYLNLRPGGYLALETQLYDHPEDPNICYFMHLQNNDPTNFWALSASALETCLRLSGFEEIRLLKKVVPASGLTENMSRGIFCARKPD